MKEKCSEHGKMIERNWVLKRKRKRLSSNGKEGSNLSITKEGRSLPSDSPKNNAPAKRRLKGDFSASPSASKRKGNDGYYFECVICDLGGNLLCCDSCPRTYHLQCLDPPLKRTPPGKWQCPSCCDREDSVKHINHPEVVSKRTRSRVSVEKSKKQIRSAGPGKLSLIIRSTIPGKNRSSGKEKSALTRTTSSAAKKLDSSQMDPSCDIKSSEPSEGRSAEGICGDIVPEKKLNLPCSDVSAERKPSSPVNKVDTSFRTSEADTNGGPSESKSAMQSPKINLTTPLDLSGQKPRKRRGKTNKGNSQKKVRTDKGKCVVNTSCKPGLESTSPRPKITRPRQRRSQADSMSISKLKKDSRKQNLPVQEKEERFPEEMSHSSHMFGEAGVEKDRIVNPGECVLDELQQVDRILGCRPQNSDLKSSSHIQSTAFATPAANTDHKNHCTTISTGLSSHDLHIPDTDNGLLEDCPAENRNVDVNDTENFFGEDSNANINGLDEEKHMQNDGRVDNICVHETPLAGTGKAASISATKESLKDQGVTSRKDEDEESALSTVADVGVTENTLPKDNADVQCINLDINSTCEVPDSCPAPVSCNSGCADGKLDITPNITSEDKKQEKIIKHSPPVDKENSSYEYLVKWVGQSHLHNSWVSESQLKTLAKRKLENYKAKYGNTLINICQEQWSQPQRIIALRVSQVGKKEALVKWCGLPYDECTWERLDEPVIEHAAHLIAEFEEFECQALEKDAAGNGVLRIKSDNQHSEIISLVEQPKELKGGSLFPHQLEALNWLRKCWHKSKNVILADEMGLGKTVSACAFISSLYFEFKASLPCLVLVPLSTMPNWLAEFALWAPHLNVVEYHGCAKARSLIRQHEWHGSYPDELQKRTTSYKFNVLLTTYEMVLADSSHLRSVPWEVLVVDEGHRLKNSGSKLFSLLNTFSFQHRVLLTGTPLQNNIGEMYNLLNFLQPVSFPSLSAFEEKFNDLTTAEKVEELKKLVSPHMLRRLKKDAMQNIPPKTERMVPLELSSIQAEYYRAMLTKNYQILRNMGKGVAHQSMLNIVMQLRKVCNHPYLIPGTEPDSGSMEFLHEMRIKASAKLTLLHSMLKVLNKEGHRVLIFSQMTKLLDILEDYLTVEFGPKTFERVDGSVSVADRQAAIARFNQDKTRFVFLLSTRSCGLGINLATADTVIIYDSDFNPHADIQAMNRAHRIGQSKRLLVYRLVVRASVEERILQLAKKKLMLDQLFVNKAESLKEVEDVLRWGTKELFSNSVDVVGKDPNENSGNKADVAADVEHKQRRKTGGLGDVYTDRCTDGCTKIVWDENAVLKLLDRSNLQSGSSESTEGDLENDMLGSVKSVEWNDEPTEDQGGSEILPSIATDVCGQSSEKKEDPLVSSTEENEWDRLLRVRWEKYQIEEEAALGRGKRLRKAVSYKETFAPHQSDALSESGNEEEPEQEPEPEPEPEYASAGRALKAKFAKLRARQKERLAQRHVAEASQSIENQLGQEVLPQFPTTPTREGEGLQFLKSLQPVRDQVAVNLEDGKMVQPSGAPKNRSYPTARPGRESKHNYKSFQTSPLDLSVRPPSAFNPDIFLPSHQFQSTSFGMSVPPNNLLPVLGLYAPTAKQLDSRPKNFHSYHERSRTARGLSELPLQANTGAGPSIDMNYKSKETMADTSTLPDASMKNLQHCLKNMFQDSCFPFGPSPPTISQGKSSDPLESSSSMFSAFQEKMAPPSLGLDEKLLPEFSLQPNNVSRSYPDLLPSLSLDLKGETVSCSVRDIPTMPLLPNFNLQKNDSLKQNQHMRELSPMLGLGQMQATYSSLPENHKRVLDNIMMRTGSGISNSSKKRLKADAWSEDELDALWIGVRRHGRGNWDAMLQDTKLKFSKNRIAEDLLERWEQEQLKILNGPKVPKSTPFPGISGGMMTRALLGSKLGSLASDHRGPPKFRTHLTDIQLGCGDLTPSMPPIEPVEHLGLNSERPAPGPAWNSDTYRSSFTGESSAGPSDRPGNSKLQLDLEQPIVPNSLGYSGFGSLNLNCSSNRDLQQKEDQQGANKYLKLPSLLDRSLNWLRDLQNNVRIGESSSGILPDPNRGQSSNQFPMKDDIAGNSSSSNKLPHWLREAVNVRARPPESNLPPTVSAIAHSVRLLYGEEKQTIPPFTAPGPPPFQPKDPRRSLKKEKRKLRRLRRITPEIATSSKNFQSSLLGDGVFPGPVPPAPSFSMIPISAASSLGLSWMESTLPSLNLNLANSPSTTSFQMRRRKTGMTMTPSPEVLNLVASYAAPGPRIMPPGMPSSSFHQSELPAVRSYELLEPVSERGSPELRGARGKRRARRRSILGSWGQHPEDRMDRTESGDSSKTHSDPGRVGCPQAEEISSEETVSDDHRSEHDQ